VRSSISARTVVSLVSTRVTSARQFSYHGSFALHLAQKAERVIALDSSAQALARAMENAELNELKNIDFVERTRSIRGTASATDRFDTIVLDPPAFAKTRGIAVGALRGYKEITACDAIACAR